MGKRQYSHVRMATQTLRWASPSALSRLPALTATESATQLGLGRPRTHAYYRSSI
jgi:hypothetical protein